MSKPMRRRSADIVNKPSPASSLSASAGSDGGGRRARKLQQTIDNISTAAWLLFEKHGFDAVTMEAIAAAADVAKGTLYKHFPVKEALIRHRFEKDRLAYGTQIAAAVLAKPSCAERLALFFQIEAGYLNGTRPYLGAYIRHLLRSGQTEQEQGDREVEAFVALLLREGQARGEISQELNADIMARHLVFMRSGTLIRWLERADSDLATMLREMLHLFLNGAMRKSGS